MFSIKNHKFETNGVFFKELNLNSNFKKQTRMDWFVTPFN